MMIGRRVGPFLRPSIILCDLLGPDNPFWSRFAGLKDVGW